jgi:tetratricopeptide (TPR) repeat protein
MNTISEEGLIQAFEGSGWQDPDILIRLVDHCLKTGGHDKRALVLDQMLERITSGEDRARVLLQIGIIMEQYEEFTLAAAYYRRGAELKPMNAEVFYYLHNNLGYSLNQLGRFADAEGHLKRAAAVDPEKYNAFKNLGVCYQGLGQLEQAVAMFVKATRTNIGDGRALAHLENLLAEHPELLERIPDLQNDLKNCRYFVEMARTAPKKAH